MTNEEDLINAMADLEEEKVIDLTNQLLKDGKKPVEIFNIIRKGMTIVGDKFASKEYFLADLIYSAEIFEEINKILMPLIKKSGDSKQLGKVVMGTVKNDIHDIGKNIVIGLLRAEGIDVIDLGVDKPIESFIEAIKKEKPKAVGLSGLLTLAIDSMKKTIEAIKSLDPNIPVIVGGGPVDADTCKYVNANDWAPDAVEAVKVFKKYLD
ncbi:MAG: cobalamin B12-binding domain-containing protein [Candidatus Helarchaeota archaeon]